MTQAAINTLASLLAATTDHHHRHPAVAVVLLLIIVGVGYYLWRRHRYNLYQQRRAERR
jgi:hypothetical protein